MKQEKGDIHTLAIIITILDVIGLILSLFTLISFLSIIVFIVNLFVTIIDLIIVWTINETSRKTNILINLLQTKNILRQKDIEIINDIQVPTEDMVIDKNITYCENCGYQLFPEDKECPYCHEKKHQKNDNQKST